MKRVVSDRASRTLALLPAMCTPLFVQFARREHLGMPSRTMVTVAMVGLVLAIVGGAIACLQSTLAQHRRNLNGDFD